MTANILAALKEILDIRTRQRRSLESLVIDGAASESDVDEARIAELLALVDLLEAQSEQLS